MQLSGISSVFGSTKYTIKFSSLPEISHLELLRSRHLFSVTIFIDLEIIN